MTATRVYADGFAELCPGYNVNSQNLADATDWSVLNIRGELLESADFEGASKVSLLSGFTGWVSENCDGRYFLAYWLPRLENDQSALVACFEDPISAMAVRLRWT